ncbi:hypothetical protein P154DRAFT_521848 [Amniculicola lignicola CBS 123094]|uniref:Uncharacterized protein n=1 Tax=Amniculicola lignicola CBS 123094 TaxID=1392246 RepID=A0A6A5WL13_9PLEO|nr:hypothetical protein P154DRAFT_521848 [Amniculicola lignicola CBS 123094]
MIRGVVLVYRNSSYAGIPALLIVLHQSTYIHHYLQSFKAPHTSTTMAEPTTKGTCEGTTSGQCNCGQPCTCGTSCTCAGCPNKK